MQCFYGYTITMRRSALLEYYSIAQFLEAGDLIRIIYNDMVTNSNNYDVFILLRVADKFEEQKIF